jgi:hypothetical protein
VRCLSVEVDSVTVFTLVVVLAMHVLLEWQSVDTMQTLALSWWFFKVDTAFHCWSSQHITIAEPPRHLMSMCLQPWGLVGLSSSPQR